MLFSSPPSANGRGPNGTSGLPANPPPKPAIDSLEFRRTLGRFASGVVVVTTGRGEERRGMTASSFTSVSLDPPLVLFCVQNHSGTLAAIEQNGTFAVNVLAEDQQATCFQFAGRSDDKFSGQSFRPGPETGAPLLEGALARLECRLSQVVPAGDHQIVIGEVLGMDRTPPGNHPLLFWGGKIQHPDGWEPEK
ncbi:MAG: flavin reductase family protein [Armatimonadetes bacterium]|nr:flavin reductase family protein [Armatimonadota bacterium]